MSAMTRGRGIRVKTLLNKFLFTTDFLTVTVTTNNQEQHGPDTTNTGQLRSHGVENCVEIGHKKSTKWTWAAGFYQSYYRSESASFSVSLEVFLYQNNFGISFLL